MSAPDEIEAAMTPDELNYALGALGQRVGAANMAVASRWEAVGAAPTVANFTALAEALRVAAAEAIAVSAVVADAGPRIAAYLDALKADAGGTTH